MFTPVFPAQPISVRGRLVGSEHADQRRSANHLVRAVEILHDAAMKLRRVLSGVVLISVLVCGGPLIAGPFEEGLTAYEAGKHAAALRLFLPLAEEGHAAARFQMGRMYARGHGLPQDHVAAVAWFRLAAEQGNADAQRNLGIMYRRGRGVPPDNAEAAAWYRLAAEQGDPAAQGDLGDMYMDGLGVAQDYVLAHMWFNLAAAQKHEGAARQLRSIARLMTADQIAEAQRLAQEWQPKMP
jgi:TPR repeat protein